MRILQIVGGYFDSNLFCSLFTELSTLGVNNLVYVPVHKNFVLPNNQEENVVVSLCFSNLDRVLFYSKQKKLLNNIQQRIDIKDINLIHAHTLFSNGYLAYELYKKYGIPYIVAVRNTDYHVFFKRMPHLRKIGINILRHAKKIIFLSPKYMERLLNEYIPQNEQNIFKSKMVVIPNGIDSIFFKEGGKERIKINSPLRILYVGEISKNKNIETTFKAIQKLACEKISVQYRVVGQIKENKYKKFLKSHGEIEYYPKCTHSEVINHMRWADIFVMPSFKETFGLVYAEALSQGLPVIYTRNEGFDSHFSEGMVGFAVNPHNPEDIAEKIKSILGDYSNFSRNALKCVGKFSWAQIALQYKEIYTDITNSCSM